MVEISNLIMFLYVLNFFHDKNNFFELKNYINPYLGISYALQFQNTTYQEKFNVQALTFGTQVKNFSMDVGFFRTVYDFYLHPTSIRLYSFSYLWKKAMFNLSLRSEYSDHMAYDTKNQSLKYQRRKDETYLGFQYLVFKKGMIGIHYNYFLLNELSSSLTLFL